MTLKLKRILISILCVLLCVCGAVALSFNATNSTFNVSADVLEIDIPEIQDFYKLSSRASFPSSVDTKVNPDDADSPMITATNGVLYYPDGKAYPVLENKVFEGSYGEEWSVAKVLRRFIWHDRIHAKAMYRRAFDAFWDADIDNVFHFRIK